MSETRTDAELMQEKHWCPWCDNDPGRTPERIDRSEDLGVQLLVPCAVHGQLMHDPHDSDCWCLK